MKKDGQISLIILLVMVVGLTIGLSLATRSVSDVKNSAQIEESSRAFSAAEAGIESALKSETPPPTPVSIGVATYTFATAPAGGTDAPLTLGKVGIADTYTIWLIGHVQDAQGNWIPDFGTTYTGNTIDVCWGDVGEAVTPAMEVTVVYREGVNYKVVRGAYDPDNVRAATKNNFSVADTVTCAGLNYKKTIDLSAITGTKIALRLRPFYSETSIGVAPAATFALPSQGLSITSTGQAGGTTRKVEVIQSYPSLPAIFDYVLFSGTGVSK